MATPSTYRRLLRVLYLGVVQYDEAMSAQRQLAAHCIEHRDAPGFLMLLQHPPIFTIRRSARDNNILVSRTFLAAKGISVLEIDRGGDITYHGPGQIVGYPIVDLHHHKRDVHAYLRGLEEVLIRALACTGISGRRIPGRTGVWVGDEKIASIGVGIRRWVTYHGFALNVDPDLEPFSYINPCGFPGARVTSVASLLERPPDVNSLGQEVAKRFAEVFRFQELEWPETRKTDSASIVEAALRRARSPRKKAERVAKK